SFVTPDTETFYPNMPKGTHVVPNKTTEEILRSGIPHFAKGTKGWLDSFKSTVGDVWDYVKKPSTVVDKLLDKIAIKTNMDPIPGAIVRGAWEFVKTKPAEFLRNKYKQQQDNNPNLGGGKPAFSWPVTSPYGFRIHPITGQPKL